MAISGFINLQFVLLGRAGVGKTWKVGHLYGCVGFRGGGLKDSAFSGFTALLSALNNNPKCRVKPENVESFSLFEKYFTQSFASTQATTSAKYMCKKIVVSHLGNETQIKLTVWDTAGEEKFRSLMPQYFRGAHGFIIVYDITNKDSFDGLNDIIDDAELFANIEGHIKIIVGNKIDLKEQRVVSRADGLEYAHSKHCLFIEASAKTNEAVDHIFEKLINEVLSSSIV